MSKKEFFYCKDVIRFSLKNATKPISTIRLRMNLHGERLTFYLPVEYKIQPRHWDKEMGHRGQQTESRLEREYTAATDITQYQQRD